MQLISDFVEWGCGFKLDEVLKGLSEEPHNEVNSDKFHFRCRIGQVCRKVLFAFTCVVTVGLAERSIARLFYNGQINRWIPTKLLCGIFAITLLAWSSFKMCFEQFVYSNILFTTLNHPSRFTGELWEFFKKHSDYSVLYLHFADIKIGGVAPAPLNDEEFDCLTEACHHLKSLNLVASGLTGQSLKKLADRCPWIEDLTLSDVHLNEEDYEELLRFTLLKNLKITHGPEFTGLGDKGKEVVLKLAPRLSTCIIT